METISSTRVNEGIKRWLPSLTLLLLAVAAGVAWRVELEIRSGWAGLTWLNYLHWAVPVSVSAFLAWVALVAPVRRRAIFVFALIVFAALAYCAVEFALRIFFTEGPAAASYVAGLGDGDFALGLSRLDGLKWLAMASWPLIPLLFCFLCRLFGAPITLVSAGASAFLFTTSWPLAIHVRAFFEQQGSPDLIHALKSGFVIPFLVVSLGFPLLRSPFRFACEYEKAGAN